MGTAPTATLTALEEPSMVLVLLVPLPLLLLPKTVVLLVERKERLDWCGGVELLLGSSTGWEVILEDHKKKGQSNWTKESFARGSAICMVRTAKVV